MKPAAVKVDLLHIFSDNFAARRVLPAVQTARHREAFGRRDLRNEIHHGFVLALDDREENVAGARAVGLRAIHAPAPAHLVEYLRDAGVKV
jgi:hypothetical protein